ncbi:TonB-dependent receptor, partial [Sphingorhabdus sp.]|uniref:TonB-dependent receptor n=1 Tax=Sphingorhabdus sp. TaxID=1902408 RepID=UPI0038FCFF00
EDSTRFLASRLGGRVRAAVGAPSITSQIQDEKRITQELRFVSEFDGPIDFIAGVFYQNVKTEGGFPPQSIIPTGSPAVLFGLAVGDSFFSLQQTADSKEFGVFGEATWELTQTLKLTGGGRYFSVKSDNTRQDGGVLYTKLYGIKPTNFFGKTSDNGFNPRAALTWEPSTNTTVYLNAAKGFRPGAANLGKAICTANGFKNVPDVVDADTLWNYEAGVKNRFLGGRISTDIAVYKITWKNRRTTVVSDCGLGFGYSDNIGEAQSEGFEFSFAADIADGVKLDGGVGYTNSRITDNGGLVTVIEGTRLADVPELSGGLALDISHEFGDVRGYGRIDARYVGESTSAQRNRRPEYALLNLRVGAQFDTFDISLFANNVTDKRANLSDPTELSDSLNLIAINRPRTIGIDVRTRF